MAEKERKPPRDDAEQNWLAMGVAFGAVPSRKPRAEEDPDTPERDD